MRSVFRNDGNLNILSSAALLYFVLMAYIVLGVLRERRPMLYYLGAAACFVLSQLAWYLLGKVICKVCILSPSQGFFLNCLPEYTRENRWILYCNNSRNRGGGSYIFGMEKHHRRCVLPRIDTERKDADDFSDTWDDYY